jgi:hypothetical protein
MRDMQCQPGQYLIAAEKEPRFADAEALALEGIKGSSSLLLDVCKSLPGSSGASGPLLLLILVLMDLNK